MDWTHEQQTRTKLATPACLPPGTSDRPRQRNSRQELKPVGLHADAPRKDSSRGGEAKAQTFGGRAGFGSCATRIPNPPIPTPTRLRRQISRPLPGARSDQRRPAIRRRGDLAEAWAGPGRAGGSRGAMASAQAPSSAAAPSRKDHLEAGKKRVGPLLPVACEKCSPCVPAIADCAICL